MADLYVAELRHGVTNGRATPSIVRESASSALVDGNNGFGSVVGNFCMDLAIEKARKTGIACVCTKGQLPLCYFYFFKYRELYIVADCSSFDIVAYLMPFPPLVKDKYGFISSIFPSQFLVMRTHVLYLLHTKVDFY